MTVLVERIATIRGRAVAEVYTRVQPLLSEQRRTELDRLLEVEKG